MRGAVLTFASVAFLGGFTCAPRNDSIEVKRAWPVMGTMLTVSAWGRDSIAMLDAIHAARDSVRVVDSLMSNYRPESEISRINASAGDEAVRVSSQTLHVLLHARELWRLSNGLFDPTVAPLVRAWGFYGESGAIPSRQALDSLRRFVGYGKVEIDSVGSSVRLPMKGMMLDLGGIAKGYALDRARRAFTSSSVSGGMIDLGGNILVFGHSPSGEKWKLGVRNPRSEDEIIGTISLDSGAIATSGDYEHFYIIDGVRYGHIIDPRTGYPSRGVIAASAIGPTGELSDGVSATFFLSGAEPGEKIADELGVMGVWVMERDGSDTTNFNILLSRGAQKIFRPAGTR